MVLLGFVFLVFFANNVSADMGKELFVQKCAVCHSLTQPTNKAEVFAPPANGLMFHMNDIFKTNEEIKAHMKSFSMEATEEKALLSGAVKKFGLMPSQKGSISENELDSIVNWMVDNLGMSKENHAKNKKQEKM